MTGQIVCRQRLFDPGKFDLLERPRAPKRLIERERLISVHHDCEALTHGLAHRLQRTAIVSGSGASDLNLPSSKAILLRPKRTISPTRSSFAGSPLSDKYCFLKTPFRLGPFFPCDEYGS